MNANNKEDEARNETKHSSSNNIVVQKAINKCLEYIDQSREKINF